MAIILVLTLFLLSSPGDSVGWTCYDLQRQSQSAQQVWFDGDAIHVDFMCAHDTTLIDRNCCYNFKLGGAWYGDSMIASYRAGFVALGVKPINNASVCAYHMYKSGDIYRTWVAVDSAQGSYNFIEHAVLPQLTTKELIWPMLAVDPQNNFHITNSEPGRDGSYYTRSTDGGITWSDTMLINNDPDNSNLAHSVFADRFNTSGKTIVCWTKWTGEGSGGIAQHCQDICYMISTDYGETWSSKINLTQYQPSDTLRAFNMVKGIFDKNGDPHLVWIALLFKNGTPYAVSWIIHWSPGTGFSFITDPHIMINDPGAWRSPSDFMNIAVDRDNGWLYLTYVLNRDSDMSQAGFPNGEIMALASTDNGLTWISNALGDTGVNLTKTPTPGADSGTCNDDDYLSMHPYVETINGTRSLIISYLEDKDAGDVMQGEGTMTDNPYRVYVVPCESIIKVGDGESPSIPRTSSLDVFPNPSGGLINIRYSLGHRGIVRIRLFDITGRMIKGLIDRAMDPGYHSLVCRVRLPSGTYFIVMESEGSCLVSDVINIK